jgi:hypothetical protein
VEPNSGCHSTLTRSAQSSLSSRRSSITTNYRQISAMV